MNTTRDYRADACVAVVATPINRVENALNEAVELAHQTMSMVASIAGSVPANSRGGSIDLPDGIIPALADRADDTVSVIEEAKGELRRLASLLGV
ncbi:hypothetical protein A6U97_02805 [Agrobacterium tumefaciens]|uniref:hypothetical protein n=1 Tax=Agrobacterium tumefaciens TaxID=358 RepID=UPI00080F9F76|nr:hypothetical protein A6U97_02805 [Agrobacterium tumefaciens]